MTFPMTRTTIQSVLNTINRQTGKPLYLQYNRYYGGGYKLIDCLNRDHTDRMTGKAMYAFLQGMSKYLDMIERPNCYISADHDTVDIGAET